MQLYMELRCAAVYLAMRADSSLLSGPLNPIFCSYSTACYTPWAGPSLGQLEQKFNFEVTGFASKLF